MGSRIGLLCVYGWGMKIIINNYTVVSVSGSSHASDVACRKNKEVSDPAVARCPRAFNCRRCLQVVRVCGVPCFSVCCVRNLCDNKISRNPTGYQESVYLISSVRCMDIKTKMIAAAVSLVW